MEDIEKKVAAGTGVVGAGFGLGSFFIASPLWKGFFLAIAVIVVLGLIAFLVIKLTSKKASAANNAEVYEALRNNSDAPTSRTPEEQKTLKEEAKKAVGQMKLSFKDGLKRLSERGVDLAEERLYLVIGEPASGKTVACRALTERIQVPEGMNTGFEGSGGTLNMDWWFYEQVILIDTAGRLMYQETKEWVELLKSLRRARPDKAINGVILAIPADSLVHDRSEEIKDKARRLRDQLEGLKRILDVRFPIYIVITKSDLLTGFREFVDHLKGEQAQDQILGWSNEADLDAPFPDLAEARSGVEPPGRQGPRGSRPGSKYGGNRASRTRS
jgi:type VI secretion system protein ImpL